MSLQSRQAKAEKDWTKRLAYAFGYSIAANKAGFALRKIDGEGINSLCCFATLAEIREHLEPRLPLTVYIFGKPLHRTERGNYPYECISADLFPSAMIYHGKGSWLSETDPLFTGRNRSLDEYDEDPTSQTEPTEQSER